MNKKSLFKRVICIAVGGKKKIKPGYCNMGNYLSFQYKFRVVLVVTSWVVPLVEKQNLVIGWNSRFLQLASNYQRSFFVCRETYVQMRTTRHLRSLLNSARCMKVSLCKCVGKNEHLLCAFRPVWWSGIIPAGCVPLINKIKYDSYSNP